MDKHKLNTPNKTTNKPTIPSLFSHSFISRRSRPLGRALPTNKRRNNRDSQTKNYSTLFSTAGKTWPSGPERLPREYGWNSSGRKQQATGFTIIEVVLVLAIAGLIFLMVFVALPALQRSQRDAQRKNDITRLKTALDSYKANNRGQLPWTKPWSYSDWETIEPTDSFMVSYMKSDKGEFKSPEGEDYDLHITSNANVGWMPSVLIPSLHVTSGTKCAADGSRMLGAGPNSYTVQQKLESGGHICVDG